MKAFDKPELSSILGALIFFNFPERITKWIKILYTGFSVKIQNNGHFSERIPILRSVHQGGCASAFLYILLAETLAMQIRANIQIEGVVTGELIHKLNLFADDMNASSTTTQQNLDNIIKTLNSFHDHSGTVPRLYTQNQIAWNTDGITILGIRITHNDIMSENIDPVFEKVKATLKRWQDRDLTLFGKVNVINTLVASLFVHKLQVLPLLPDRYIKNV